MRACTNGGTVLDAAREYTRAGARVVPVGRRSKAPVHQGWQQLRLAEEDLTAHIGAESNLGIILGEPSGGVVDVDIDCELFRHFVPWLPKTELRHGRGANPDSHYWYRIAGALPATTRLSALDGTVIVEIRSTGAQTVVPPSVYLTDSGQLDVLNWSGAGEPATVSKDELERAVHRAAAATILAMNWPAQGGRHQASLALSSMLLRGGWTVTDTEVFVGSVAEAAGDDEADARVANVATTERRVRTGQPTTGIPALKQLIDERAVDRAIKWLRLGSASDSATEWPDPTLLSECDLPEIPAALLPGAYGDFASALAQSTETPEAMPVLTVLAIAATAAAQNFAVSPLVGWLEPLNLYTLVAMPPASNKSQVLRRCLEPLVFWEFAEASKVEPARLKALSDRRNLEAAILSYRHKLPRERDPQKQALLKADLLNAETQLHQLQVPAIPKLFLNDATPESLAQAVIEQGGRIAVISDEGGFFETVAGLYTNGRANNDIVLKGIDGGDVRIERRERSIRVRPHLTLALVVQPQVLKDLGDRRSLQGKGLQERFLYVIPRSTLGRRRLVNPPVPTQVEAAYSRALNDLLSVTPQRTIGGVPKPREIKLADDASVLWQSWRQELEPMLADDGELENFRGWGGKLAGFTLRLAGLIELMAGGPQSSAVTGDSMTRAITMARLLVPHAQAAAGMMAQNPTEALADRVLKKVLDLGSLRVQKHELHRSLRGGFKNVRALDDALQLLEERGLLRACDVQTTAGKRTTRMYDVNPKLLGPSPMPAAA